MAIMTIRSTYALDVDTVRSLERLAKQWGVSKSEALRRSIQTAAGQTVNRLSPASAFEELQRSLRLSKPRAHEWEKAVRATRRVSAAKRFPR